MSGKEHDATEGAGGSSTRDWRRLSREDVAHYDAFSVQKVRARSPRNGKVFEYHIIDLPDWVSVVAVTADGKVVMAEQFRHGAGEWTLEFPSGLIDDGEPPCKAGLRELKEETGYRAAEARVIAEFYPNPALQTNRMHVILATGCEPTGERGQDDGEDVHVRLVEPEEIPRLIDAGRIDHALAIMTWYWYRVRGGTG